MPARPFPLAALRLTRLAPPRSHPWRCRVDHAQIRRLHLNPFITPPLLFCGLLAALWTWKCIMLVVFQNKIIYMPGLPPNARRETIADYEAECRGIQWREERIRSTDNTKLALCVADVRAERPAKASLAATRTPVYILYFQG